MGNYKFKFSDMIPNAWLYKLKYISRTKNQNSMQKTKKKNHPITKSPTFSTSSSAVAASPQLNYQRKSYHFTRDLPPTPDNNSASQLLDTPRRSSKKRRSIKKSRPLSNTPRLLVTSSVSTDCSCRASVDERQNFPPGSCSSEEDNSCVFPELGSESGDKPFDKIISTCHCRLMSDIPYGVTMTKDSKLQNFDSISQFELRPIITKTDKVENNEEVCNMRRIGTKTEERISYSCSKEQRIIRKLSGNNNISTGVKLRTNSPRIASKRFVQVHHRKSVSSGNGGGKRRSLTESFAVVKTSKDPHKDFKESMVEMIMENNIRSSKDLEDLLACYLTLNSDQYHDMIIKVFKQIWFEITDVRY